MVILNIRNKWDPDININCYTEAYVTPQKDNIVTKKIFTMLQRLSFSTCLVKHYLCVSLSVLDKILKFFDVFTLPYLFFFLHSLSLTHTHTHTRTHTYVYIFFQRKKSKLNLKKSALPIQEGVGS